LPVAGTASAAGTQTTLYSFGGTAGDGFGPYAGLTQDADGALYGTTFQGGSNSSYKLAGGCGTVFKLTPGPDGTWTESVLYSFAGGKSDGYEPASVLLLDAEDALYGTAAGGASNYGVVFARRRGRAAPIPRACSTASKAAPPTGHFLPRAA
jgi:uncharacterized repeat protein (TIGR03803 family)